MYTKDYYRILGITTDASAGEIKSAYRKLAKRYHPDRNADNPDDVEKLKEINDAYHVLGHSQRKMAYDMMYRVGIKDNPLNEKAFRYADLETILHAFSVGEDKVWGRPCYRKRGFGRRGCGRRFGATLKSPVYVFLEVPDIFMSKLLTILQGEHWGRPLHCQRIYVGRLGETPATRTGLPWLAPPLLNS